MTAPTLPPVMQSVLASLSDRWRRFAQDGNRSEFDSGRMLQIEVTIALMSSTDVVTVRKMLQEVHGVPTVRR